ncbi:DUF3822 family protein [Winogradskyella sp. A3E31]|uniref:DUF3822 family protein n=1 Tax=Winogradskyella sp. A3E31 TaxID=3349637 RepID=UPI00398ABCD6
MTNKISKELSIQVDLNGLSFCILDTSEDKFTYFKRLEFKSKLTPFDTLNALKAELSSNTVFSGDFKSVLIIHQNELSTLVPKALYDASNNADYLKFNSKILQTDFITKDKLKSIEAVNVFIPYVNINNYIFETFGEFTYKHASTVLIDTIIEKYSTLDETLFVNVHKGSMEVIVMKDKQLELFNRFDYTTTEDFLYYILFVAEQLNLNPETLIVKLSGTVTKDSPLFESIYKYIRHVDVLECSTTFNCDTIAEIDRLPNNFIILNSI